ncbi:MAG: lipoyl(octanoyl) transferase LipB [Bdellovibrionales bacterium]|nr:lipoyl(octanoyl) transferase LipB [Bdellovibrionales bacterium]
MRIDDWGLVEYQSAVDRQLAAVDDVAGGGEERLIFCTHPPVVTLGRATPSEDLIGWQGSTVESSRGGRATYHGPNQIVIYPILDLRRARGFGIPARDIHAYLRGLESATVMALRELGMTRAEARTTQVGEISLTGVWIGERKIASMGIAVRKWVTYHGVAINIIDDPKAFVGIRPCGFAADVMTSAEKELGRPLVIEDCKRLFASVFGSTFA